MHRDERLFQTVHQSSELWLKLAVLRDRGGDRAHRRRRSRARRAPARPRQPLRDPRDRRAARARAPLALGVPRAAQGARPRQRLRLARLAAAAAPRSTALERVRGAARRAAAWSSATSTCASGEHPCVYDLAEALIEFDERIAIWRSVHVKMVQRVIGGGAVGTQGTPVAVLAGMTTKELFPQLWAVRNRLTEIADGASESRSGRLRRACIDADACAVAILDQIADGRREPARMERVCVIGAGAIGSLFAGHLAAVADVSVLTRRDEHAEALRPRRAAHQRAQRAAGERARLVRSRRAAAVRPRHRRDQGGRPRRRGRLAARPLPATPRS